MFSSAFEFNQDLSNWNLLNCESTRCMFEKCLALKQDLSNLKPKKENADTYDMFNRASKMIEAGLIPDWYGENGNRNDEIS